MAIKLFLRSKSGTSSTIYLTYQRGRNFKITLKTPYSINPEHWDESSESYKSDLLKTLPKSSIEKNFQKQISLLDKNLSVLKSDFNIHTLSNPEQTEDELKEYYNKKYFPEKFEAEKRKKEIAKPQKLVDFIELYIKDKSETLNGEQTPITEGTIKSYRRVKNHIIALNPNLLISEVNNNFRKVYSKYCETNKYKLSYQTKHLGYLKTFCKYAFEHLGYNNISNEVLRWDFKNAKKKIREKNILHPIFNFDEINRLQNHIFKNDYLSNARDWLIISIFTGQRVSDFLDFSKSKIVQNMLLEMVQRKTGSENTIFLLPAVIAILKKRNGDFPRKISDQRYNEYIKQVCEIVGINEIIEGEKTMFVEVNGKMVKRNVRGFYPKHELITSHVGRRSFVSISVQMNISETAIMQQTGHKTTEMIRAYNQTSAIDKAKINGEELLKLKLS